MVIILPLRRGCFHLGNTRIPTMDLKKLFTEERAVSPVIGVILMVAITVILAAVIGAFVLGLGGETQETPQASLNFALSDGNNSAVNIEHRSGNTFNLGDVRIGGDVGGEFDGDTDFATVGTEDDFGAGDRISTDEDGEDGDRIVLIHEPSDGVIASTTL